MIHSDRVSFLEFAKDLALEAGTVLEKYWGKLSSIEEKSASWDLVTEADRESEQVILRQIKTQFPDHQILSEESGHHEGKKTSYTWIIDPLDGTTNYTHQYPFVSVSIALAFEGRPIVGVVYNPILKELFCAASGLGATLNGSAVKVSKTGSLEKSLLATGFAYDRKEVSDNNYAEFCYVTHHSQGVRRGGSAALDLAYVAAGRLDGYWERGLKPWDIAAGIVLIQEAGGKVSSYEGRALDLDSGRILASNGIIHNDLQRALSAAHGVKIVGSSF